MRPLPLSTTGKGTLFGSHLSQTPPTTTLLAKLHEDFVAGLIKSSGTQNDDEPAHFKGTRWRSMVVTAQ